MFLGNGIEITASKKLEEEERENETIFFKSEIHRFLNS